MEPENLKALAKSPLFTGMTPAEIEMAMAGASYRLTAYDKHDIYALAGMPCKHAGIAVIGTLVCRMPSLPGKQVEVGRRRPTFCYQSSSSKYTFLQN